MHGDFVIEEYSRILSVLSIICSIETNKDPRVFIALRLRVSGFATSDPTFGARIACEQKRSRHVSPYGGNKIANNSRLFAQNTGEGTKMASRTIKVCDISRYARSECYRSSGLC